MGTAEDTERYLQQTQRAKKLLDQFNSEESTDGQEIFHEVYVVGDVKEWHPRDRGGQCMGYGLFPMDNPLGPEASDMGIRSAVVVSFDEIGGIKPCPFDIVHVQRLGGWTGRRISIEVIK